jgi:hypothetical protein
MRAITFVALVGGFFVAYNVAQSVKARAHRARADTARERATAAAASGAAAGASMVTQQDWARAQAAARAPTRLLNNALSIDVLDVRWAPRRERMLLAPPLTALFHFLPLSSFHTALAGRAGAAK